MLTHENRFVTFFFLFPLTCFIGLSFFATVRLTWAAPLFNLLGIYVFANLARRTNREQAGRVAAASLAVSLIVFTGFAAYREANRNLSAQPSDWQSWPQREITNELDHRWEEQVGKPLRIVAGDMHLAGAVAYWSPSKPSMFDDLDLAISPWISKSRIAQEGMLVVWQPGSKEEARVESYLGHYRATTRSFVWSSSRRAAPVTVSYVIVPPRTEGRHDF
jgi:hypothetical protein